MQVCLRHRKPRTSEYAEEKRKAFNLRSGKSNARVQLHVIIEDCARRFVLLKLSTYRHEASRGLFVTAELLVEMKVAGLTLKKINQ